MCALSFSRLLLPFMSHSLLLYLHRAFPPLPLIMLAVSYHLKRSILTIKGHKQRYVRDMFPD